MRTLVGSDASVTARLTSDGRPGHGLTFEFRGNNQFRLPQNFSLHDVQLNVYGDAFRALPASIRSFARWLLPMKLSHRHYNYYSVGDYTGFGISNCSLSIGRGRLSHSTVLQQLERLQASGDPPFLLEVTSAMDTASQSERFVVVETCTKASALLRSLRDSSSTNISLPQPWPPFDKRPSIFALAARVARWLLMPVLFSVNSWMWLIRPAWFEKGMASLTCAAWFVTSAATEAVVDVLPPSVTKLSSAFRLGQIQQILEHSSRDSSKLLAEAGSLAGRAGSLKIEELATIMDTLLATEAQRGIVQRVTGFFSFVNVMWLLSIILFSVSIGPSLYHILEHYFRDICVWFYRRVLKPTAEFMHEHGIFEIMAYLIAAAFVADGSRMLNRPGVSPDVAMFITLTGQIFSMGLFGYSTALHAPPSKNHTLFTQVAGVWNATVWIPLAMLHGSTLMGYMAVVSLYSAIGFSVMSGNLCIFIGFDSKDALPRCVATSFVVLVSQTVLRIRAAAIPHAPLEPFCSALAVMGGVVYYLGMLIESTSSVCRSDQRRTSTRSYQDVFFARNAIMCGSLFGGAAAGSIFGIPGLFNTAIVFSVLYGTQKYVDFHIQHEFNGWILVTLLSIPMYYGSLWLHLNPAVVISIFNWGAN